MQSIPLAFYLYLSMCLPPKVISFLVMMLSEDMWRKKSPQNSIQLWTHWLRQILEKQRKQSCKKQHSASTHHLIWHTVTIVLVLFQLNGSQTLWQLPNGDGWKTKLSLGTESGSQICFQDTLKTSARFYQGSGIILFSGIPKTEMQEAFRLLK